MQAMKPVDTTKSTQTIKSERVVHRRWIAFLIVTIGLAFVLGTSGFQTYFSKERRLIVAGNEIVTALKAYHDASPGTVKEYPLELADLKRDPRMLAEKGYLMTLPVDPVAQKMDWGVVRNKYNQVIGVHSLSNDSPTLIGRLLSLQGAKKYSDCKFIAE